MEDTETPSRLLTQPRTPKQGAFLFQKVLDMDRKKNRGLRFFPLAKYVKARRDAQKYKALFGQEFVDRAIAEARAKIALTDRNFTNSLLEWLTLYPLQAKSVEELEKWRKDYREFVKFQSDKYEEERKKYREVRLLVNGKNRAYRVSY